MRKTQWTEEQLSIIKKEYKKGTNYRDIANLLGENVHKDTVRSQAIRMGLSVRTKKWTTKEVQDLEMFYKKGLTVKEMSNILNRSVHGIAMKLSNMGMSNRLNYWTNEEISNLRDCYKKKLTSEEISKILGKNVHDIRTKASNLGIADPRIYKINENYFNVVDTQKKAYWLGWLVSDGNIRSKTNRITLKLASKDKEVLEDMRRDLDSNYKFYYEKPFQKKYNGVDINHYGSYAFSFTSKKIKESLLKYGVTPNKTYTCHFPKLLEEEFYPGFIAGIISGDGSISNKKTSLRGSFVGTKELVYKVKFVLEKSIGLNPDKKIIKRDNSPNLYMLSFSLMQTVNLYYWFRENNISLMPRKNKIIEDFLETRPDLKREVA